MTKCPFCAEEIQEEAIVCKHCGRDLNAPPPKDRSVLKNTLEQAVQTYLGYGYALVSQMEAAAILERRGPIIVPTLFALILLFWPGAIIYALPSARKTYRVQLAVNPDGRLDEWGGTNAEIERDQSKAQRTGWIFLGVIAALLVCAVVSSLMRHY